MMTLTFLRGVCALIVVAATSRAASIEFEGAKVHGTEHTSSSGATRSFLELLDTAIRQYSADEYEFQSVNQLYRGDWDGVMEGPTWGAWWTQNSFGPTMAGLPFMSDVTYAAHFHSMRWWFAGIGDGDAQGLTREGPAPDGCLCDAAMPCVPRAPGVETCAYYKQGDGLVPLHDWTIEETLSGVVMQAEMLLISRNVTGTEEYMPLFMRTSDLLESRRDPATANTTFLTGPSTNLLAPSFGGGPNATRAYLAGVSITYTAALDRMIELTDLVDDRATKEVLQQRRQQTVEGLGRFLQSVDAQTLRSAALNGSRFHESLSAGASFRKLSHNLECTAVGDKCGPSQPSASPCCGNATCRQPYHCGGAPPPPDQPFTCFYAPPAPAPGCHAVGEPCKRKRDCCLDTHCDTIFCDTDNGVCAQSPPPPAQQKPEDAATVTNSTHYFVRSIDPESSGGARHGVIGATQFGYFEASPNHDAVAWGIVNDSLAEEIMRTIDQLGDAIRPHDFILPNTDAGACPQNYV